MRPHASSVKKGNRRSSSVAPEPVATPAAEIQLIIPEEIHHAPTKLPVLLAFREGARGRRLAAITRPEDSASIKAVIAGNSEVHKANFLSGISDNPHIATTIPSIDIQPSTMRTPGGPVKVEMLRHSPRGQQHFGGAINDFYRTTDCVFVMANPGTDHTTLEALTTSREAEQRLLHPENVYSWHTVFYDGHAICLEPYTPESLARALHNRAPRDLGVTSRALLTEVARHFDLSAAPRRGCFGGLFAMCLGRATSAVNPDTPPVAGPDLERRT